MIKKMKILLVTLVIIISAAMTTEVKAADEPEYKIMIYNNQLDIFVDNTSYISYDLRKDGESCAIYSFESPNYNDESNYYQQISISSADTTIAEIDDGGYGYYVRGLKEGSTTITISYKDIEETIKINVHKPGFRYNDEYGIKEITIPQNTEVVVEHAFSNAKFSVSKKNIIAYEHDYSTSLKICPLKTGKTVLSTKVGKKKYSLTINVVPALDVKVSPACSWYNIDKKSFEVNKFYEFTVTNISKSDMVVSAITYNKDGEKIENKSIKLAKNKSAKVSASQYTSTMSSPDMGDLYSTDKVYSFSCPNLLIKYKGQLYEVVFGYTGAPYSIYLR